MPNSAITTLIADAVARRVFPGAVVLVAHGAELLHYAAYGSTMYDDANSAPVRRDTRYDIASLTKVFTATAALQLIDEGLAALDDPADRYLPRLRARGVTLRHLLTHSSGLDLRLSTLRAGGRAGILAAVYAAEPVALPGTRVAYTNINSLLLGELVATLRGEPLDRAIERFILAPLGMAATGFLPDAALYPSIAPTEWDQEWRGGLVHGSVHDESAHALGGVAGHAGLFSTAADLHRFCLAWLAGGPPLLCPASAAAAVSNQTPGLELSCGLGWMLDRPAFMGAAAPGCYGHTGFTGPVMLVVPRHQLCIVLLTNRTYPRRRPPEHHAVIANLATIAIDRVRG